ncbi:MAG: hypothetical protein WCP03_00990 [Candidatus Saccharibacteria bacterium]
MNPQDNNNPYEPGQDNNVPNIQPPAFTSPPDSYTSPIATPTSEPSSQPLINLGFVNNLFGSGSNTSEFNGIHYLLMYALSLGFITSMLSSLASLLEICFNYVGSTSSGGDSFLSGYTLKLLVWLVVNLIVITPIYVFLLFKIRKVQPDTLPTMTRRVRSLLFGVFMTILGFVIVLSVVNTIYSLAVQFLPKEGEDSKTAWWVGTAQALVMTLLLGVTFWYQLKSFRGKQGV